MDINATLIGQMLTFAILVWFTMKFVWPPLTQMMEERTQRIAEGLAAADKARHDLELAEKRAAEKLREAKVQTSEIIHQAELRATQIVEEAKNAAREEGLHQLAAAKAEIENEIQRAKEALREQVAALSVAGAEQILRREINAQAHADILLSLKAEL